MATSHRYPDDLFDAGEFDADCDPIEVTDLANGGVFATVPAAGSADARQALATAAGAERAMAESTLVERATWLETIADAIEARRDRLADVIVREAGKPIAGARSEVDMAAERFRRAVEEVHDLQGEFREGTTSGHEGWRAVVRPEPVGTVLCLAPYNYPFGTTALQVAPALAGGNSVVLKPATKTPISGAVLAACIDEADLPEGAFSYLPGRSRDVGDVLVGDDRVDAIAMTGSSPAGDHVARESGMAVLHMELGGNAPAIVFPDADLEAAAGACAKGALSYAGQRCSAVSRVLAHESVHDALVSLIDREMDDWTAGDLFDEDTKLGPLIDESQAEYVVDLIDDAVERGADLVRGGERDGRFVEPALLANVPHDARLVHEEQFGPVVPVAAVADETEALDLANGGDLGLDAAVFTADYDRAMDVADRVQAGSVRINGAPSHGMGDLPFGGVGASGIGREGLGYTIEAFTTTKTIVL